MLELNSIYAAKYYRMCHGMHPTLVIATHTQNFSTMQFQIAKMIEFHIKALRY